MGNDRSDRLVEEWLFEEILAVADVTLADLENDLNKPVLEQVIWEGVSLGIDVDGADHTIETHKIYSDETSAKSVKGSNISFDIDELVQVLATSAATVGATLTPTGGSQLLAAILALDVIRSIKSAASEDLDVEDAVVFVAMHRGADGTIVTKSDLREEIDSFVEEIDPPVTVSNDRLQLSIDRLIRIGAVDVVDTGSEPRYRPIEEYSVTFDNDG